MEGIAAERPGWHSLRRSVWEQATAKRWGDPMIETWFCHHNPFRVRVPLH